MILNQKEHVVTVFLMDVLIFGFLADYRKLYFAGQNMNLSTSLVVLPFLSCPGSTVPPCFTCYLVTAYREVMRITETFQVFTVEAHQSKPTHIF